MSNPYAPKKLLRNQLAVIFKNDPRLIKAFEDIINSIDTTFSGDIETINKLISDVSIIAETGNSTAQSALSLLENISDALDMISTNPVASDTATNIANGETGDILYQLDSNVTGKLTIGSSSQILESSGAAPAWVNSLGTGSVLRRNNPECTQLFIADTSAPPTPSGGGVLYVEAGELKYIGSAGTITVIAPA